MGEWDSSPQSQSVSAHDCYCSSACRRQDHGQGASCGPLAGSSAASPSPLEHPMPHLQPPSTSVRLCSGGPHPAPQPSTPEMPSLSNQLRLAGKITIVFFPLLVFGARIFNRSSLGPCFFLCCLFYLFIFIYLSPFYSFACPQASRFKKLEGGGGTLNFEQCKSVFTEQIAGMCDCVHAFVRVRVCFF